MKHSKITRGLAGFCKDKCPICKKAREESQNGMWRRFVAAEEHLCPACRAYRKIYRVHAYEKADS